MGSPAKEAREWTVPHLSLSPKAQWDRAGGEAPELDHVAVPKVSPHTAAGDQALPSLRSLMMARKPAANPKISHEEDTPCRDEDAEVGKGDIEVLSNGHGDEGQGCVPIQNTLTGVSHVFGTHEETDAESNTEKVQSARQKRCQTSPKEDMASRESSKSSSEEEQPTNKAR